MEDMIALSYKEALLTDSEVEQIKSQFQSDQVEIHFHKIEGGKVYNQVGAEDIAAELFFDVAKNLAWDVFKTFSLVVWDRLKDKLPKVYESRSSTTLTEITYLRHYIKIEFKISDDYYQHFLISNKLERKVLEDNFSEMLKASEKYKSKWEQLEIQPHYSLDEIRLTKKGKWKRIKDLNKFREKAKKHQLRKIVP